MSVFAFVIAGLAASAAGALFFSPEIGRMRRRAERRRRHRDRL